MEERHSAEKQEPPPPTYDAATASQPAPSCPQQPFPGQPYPGQPFSGQQQPYPGQQQPYPGQQYPGQQYYPPGWQPYTQQPGPSPGQSLKPGGVPQYAVSQTPQGQTVTGITGGEAGVMVHPTIVCSPDPGQRQGASPQLNARKCLMIFSGVLVGFILLVVIFVVLMG